MSTDDHSLWFLGLVPFLLGLGLMVLGYMPAPWDWSSPFWPF